MAESGGCAFCGGGPLSAEHVFSRRWIERFSPDASSHTHELLRSVAPGEPDLRRTYTTRSPEGMVVSGAVCERCNNGWMNDLDLAVQPLLNAIVDGAEVAVSAEQRRLFATWACNDLIDEVWNVTPTRRRCSRLSRRTSHLEPSAV